MPEKLNTHGTAAADTLRRMAWLFPATYAIHILEEYVGGFYTWVGRFGVEMTATYFLIGNGILWLLMTAWIAGTPPRNRARLLGVLATIVLVNGVGHTLASLALRTYSPGTVSGILLWVPLGGLTLLFTHRILPVRQFRLGLIVGLLLHTLLPLAAYLADVGS